MNHSRIVRVLEAPFLLLFILACSGPQEPIFRAMTNVEVQEFSMQEATIRAEAMYYNPNAFGVTIKASQFHLRANEVDVGTVVQEHQIQVKGNEEFLLPVVISFPPEKILADGDRLLNSVFQVLGNKRINLHYQGTITVEVAGIDMQIPFEYLEEVKVGRKNP